MTHQFCKRVLLTIIVDSPGQIPKQNFEHLPHALPCHLIDPSVEFGNMLEFSYLCRVFRLYQT